MHKFSTALAVSAALLLALPALAAPDDGTFVINITGPGEVEAPQAAPQPAAAPVRRAPLRTAAPRAQAPASPTAAAAAAPAETAAAQAAPAEPARSYAVQRNDTIWSIANRYLPRDNAVNEFQIVAAIYRANQQAFTNGDINQLRRVTLTIPPQSQIAREDQQTGINLLRGTSRDLPPLAPAAPQTQPQPAAPVQTPAQPAVQTAESAATMAPPEFTARETRIREGESGRTAAQNHDSAAQLLPAENTSRPDEFYNDADGSAGDAQGQTLTEENDPGAQANTELKPVSQPDIDFAAVRDLIDSTRKSIELHDQEIEKQLTDAISRSEEQARNAAQDAAHEEVFSIMSRYEAIISDLQQSNAELRANISKLSKQIDQVRQMSLDSADELELIKQNIEFKQSGNTALVPQGPLMFIVLGLGLMSLVLAVALFIFRRKARHTAQVAEDDDFGFDDDLSSTELLSSTVLPEKADETKPDVDPNDLSAQVEKDQQQKAAQDEPEQEPDDTSAPEPTEPRTESEKAAEPQPEAAAPGGVEVSDSSKAGAAAGAGVEVVQPGRSDKDSTEVAESQEAAGRTADTSVGLVDEVKIPKNIIPKDQAAAAWDQVKDQEQSKPAASAGQSMDAWAKAQAGSGAGQEIELDDKPAAKEPSQPEKPQAAPARSAEEEMAAQWEAALKEQAAAEQKAAPEQAKPQAAPARSAEEEMAAQWEAALKEQAAAEHKAAPEPDKPKATPARSAEEEMAAQWEAALKEQAAAEHKAAPAPDKSKAAPARSAEEEMAAQWEAALKEQAAAEQHQTETQQPEAEPPRSADDKSALQQEDALKEPSDPKPQAPAESAAGAAPDVPEEAAAAAAALHPDADAHAAKPEESEDAARLRAQFGGQPAPDEPPSAIGEQLGTAQTQPAEEQGPAAEAQLSPQPPKAQDPAEAEIKPDDPLFSVFDQFLNGKTVDDNLKRQLSDASKAETAVPESAELQPKDKNAQAEVISALNQRFMPPSAEKSAPDPEPAAEAAPDPVPAVEPAMPEAPAADSDEADPAPAAPAETEAPAEPETQAAAPAAEPSASGEVVSWAVPDEEDFDITTAAKPHSASPAAAAEATPDLHTGAVSEEGLLNMLSSAPAEPGGRLSEQSRRELTDLLNMAQLYCESDNRAEAASLLNAVKEQGDQALKLRAAALEQRYGIR